MNRALVDRIAGALLYEGYLLYPYRPSVKNRHRWTFGGLYPPAYAVKQGGSDASSMQTQCLVRGGPDALLTGSVRFLQLVARRVGELDSPPADWPGALKAPVRFVESLRLGEDVVHAWQEALEREVPLGVAGLGDLAAGPRHVEFGFGPQLDREPVLDAAGAIAGLIEREQRRIDGALELSAQALADHLFRVTVRIENQTSLAGAAAADRDLALMYTLVSTHTILGIENGEFVSLLDPPDPLRDLAAGCQNLGTYPVLIGTQGEADTVLSSPIILYDYLQIAPESPGDLFDATEIDEILTLRIMTLTDDEKRSMAALDDRGRALLERTEALARDQLMGLHGTIRDLRPQHGGPNHG
jgi:hypothetical protein